MNTELIFDLAGLWLAFACLFYMVDGWRARRKLHRIEQEIRTLYTYATANCSMGYIHGIKDTAELLGVELEDTDGDD